MVPVRIGSCAVFLTRTAFRNNNKDPEGTAVAIVGELHRVCSAARILLVKKSSRPSKPQFSTLWKVLETQN